MPTKTEDGKIRPSKVFESVNDVHVELNGAKAQAQTFYNLAKTEERGLSTEELDVVEQQMEYHDWLTEEELPRMAKFEKMRNDETHRLLMKTSDAHSVVVSAQNPYGYQSQGQSQIAAPQQAMGAKKLVAFRPQAFGGHAEAWQAATDAGHFLRAILGGKENPAKARESRKYCQAHQHLNAAFEQSMDAQTVDDDTKGGYLVPDVVSSTIIDVRNRWGVISQLARNYPMASEVDLVPKRGTGLTVYKPGEDTAVTTSEKTWSQVSLTANDAYTLTYVSHKLMRGAVVNAADQVINEIGHAFAKQQDAEGINGDGVAGAPHFGITGVITALLATGTAGLSSVVATDWGTLTSADVNALVGLLPDRYHEGASFLCSRSFWAQVIEPMLEDRGASKTDIASTSVRSLKGYPIFFSEAMETAVSADGVPLLFGNFYDGMLLGERESVGIAQSTENRFEFDQIAIRGRFAYDIQFHDPGDATDAGAIVGLTTPAI